MKNISEMSMEEVSARMAEINTLLADENQEADIEALTAEVDALEARAAELRTAAEARAALTAKVASGYGTVIAGTQTQEGHMNEREERAVEFARTGHMELRQVLATGTIAKPTKADGVSPLAEVADDIVDDVHSVPLTGTGAWTVAYQKTNAAAADITDGSAVAGTAATFDYVTINPGEWGVLDEISKQVRKMTPVAYEQAVSNAALAALRAKASAKIVAAVKASTLTEAKTNVALDADYLKTVALGFRSIKGKGNTCLYLAQADLLTLGKVRGTAEKRALYEITFDPDSTTSGVIKEGGLAVRFRVLDQLTAGEQLYGQPGAIDLCLWDGYTVETDEGGDYFKRNMVGIRGLQTAGADVVAYHGMQRITQPTQGNS